MTAIAISISVFMCLCIVCFQSWFKDRLYDMAEQRHARERDSISTDLLAIIKKKDERIAQLDADYKSLAESYIRETGKVYIRPATNAAQGANRLDPPQPSAFRMKPAPAWAERRDKTGTEAAK